jgi:hypothetical protein
MRRPHLCMGFDSHHDRSLPQLHWHHGPTFLPWFHRSWHRTFFRFYDRHVLHEEGA